MQPKLSSHSRLALLGPIVLRDVISVIASCGGSAGMEQRIMAFGIVLEVVSRILAVANGAGGTYHNLRTRHLVSMLTQHLRTPTAAAQLGHAPPQVDALFMSFVSRLAAMSADQWASELDKFVPPQYIGPLGALFASADEWLSTRVSAPDGLTPDLLERLLVRLRFQGPGPSYTYVKVLYKCKSSPVAQWRLKFFVTGRVQSFLRKLMEQGVAVVPGSAAIADRGVVQFFVPNTDVALRQVTKVFKPFGAEVQRYREECGAPVVVKIKLHS
jgi:hypothetical protein